MLDKGFKEQIYDIYRFLPPSTHFVLASATLPGEVLDMTTKYMNDPRKILVKRDASWRWNESNNFFVAVEKEDWKFDTLCDLCNTLAITGCHILQYASKSRLAGT